MSRANSFIRIQTLWYKKLKEDGFQDIEDTTKSYRPLKSWHSFKFGYAKMDEETADYYERALEFLYIHKFKNESQRLVWELHCGGMPEREIASRVKVYKKTWVHIIIAELDKLIGCK